MTKPVDKRTFIAEAPLYYALAIVEFLSNKNAATAWSAEELRDIHMRSEDDGDPESATSLMGRKALFDLAITWLAEQDLITVYSDPFADDAYVKGEHFFDVWQELAEHPTNAFGRYQRLNRPKTYIRSALERIEDYYVEQQLNERDFNEEAEDEWEPLPIEAGAAEIEATAQAVDAAIEVVRGSNGYPISERNYVVDSLTSFNGRLRAGIEISVGYIRSAAFEPLKTAMRRLGGSTAEAVLKGAKEAVVALVKKYATDGMARLIELMLRNW